MASPRRLASRRRYRPTLEALEDRFVLTGDGWGEPIVDDTLLKAHVFADFALLAEHTVEGEIGDSPFGNRDVDFYALRLDQASFLRVLGEGSVALTLYNTDDPFNFLDANAGASAGHRQLAQSNVGDPILEINLAPGTYYVAVSGEGNRWFNAYLEDSGLPGAFGSYRLNLQATPIETEALFVLNGTVMPDGTLVSCPPWLHFSLSQGLDPNSTITVLDEFGNEQYLWWSQFSPVSQEIQLQLINPLVPGSYRVSVQDFSGEVLSIPFTIAGVDDGTGPNDTFETAQTLAFSPFGTASVSGIVGDDPGHDFLQGLDPSADVDFYVFDIVGEGLYAVALEVFAGRIGSPLDAGLALFQRHDDGSFTFLAGNDNTGNTLASQDVSLMPIFSDPALILGLPAGRYYLAVTSGANVLETGSELAFGENGFFDPRVSHSGLNPSIPGRVLHVSIQPAQGPAPTVVQAVPQTSVDGVLTGFSVRFDDAIQLAGLTPERVHEGQGAIYLRAVDPHTGEETGPRFYPRLAGFDPVTWTANYTLRHYLEAGTYVLHVAGSEGLVNYQGQAVVDFTQTWTIISPARPGFVLGPGALPSDPPATLGPVFEADFTPHVVVERIGSVDGLPDTFRFDLVADGSAQFVVQSAGPARITIRLADGTEVTGEHPNEIQVPVTAGEITVRVEAWDAGSLQEDYQVRILLASEENPTPLRVGPAPAARLQLRAVPLTFQPPNPTPPPTIAPGGTSTTTGTPGILLLTLGTAPRRSDGDSSAPTGVLSGLSATPMQILQGQVLPPAGATADLEELDPDVTHICVDPEEEESEEEAEKAGLPQDGASLENKRRRSRARFFVAKERS